MAPWQAHIGEQGSPDGKVFPQNEICAAEPELLSMVDVDWLEGNASGLKDANTVVLAESVADKWFGRWQYAAGKVVVMGSAHVPFRITGIFKDLPDHTEMPLEMVLSYETVRQQFRDFSPTRTAGIIQRVIQICLCCWNPARTNGR